MQDHPTVQRLGNVSSAIGFHDGAVLIFVELCFNRQIPNVPHRVIVARELPIEDVHAFVGIDKVLGNRVVIAGNKLKRLCSKRLADDLSFFLNVLISLRKTRILASQNFQIFNRNLLGVELGQEFLASIVDFGKSTASAGDKLKIPKPLG